MKKAFILVFAVFAWSACEKTTDTTQTNRIELARHACGSDMQWLQNLVAKAEEDRKTKKYLGAYMGTIYLGKYQGSPVFMITMMLNSGGLPYHTFDCDSQRVVIPDPGFYNDTKARAELVYSNGPYR